ncbi:XylR family transcriptional regulator [Mariniblastus sp.]|nr:XylR family transcriptional regulator [Mariniblastus sp.]MDB4460140.1 XylR family transcriptional regulator [bacterium]
MTHEIAVSIEPISDNNQAMLRGVIDYVSTHPDLRVHKIGAIPFLPLERLIDWKGAGVICTTEKLERLNTVANLKIPCVSVSLHQDPPASLPTVHSDNEAIGKLAAEHLFEIGLRNFAFVGHLNWLHNQERLLGFQTELRKKGADCEIINVQFSNSKQWVWPSEIRQRPLANALKRLHNSVGIFAAHDEFGHDVVETLKRLKMRIPYDAAVVGVNNNRLICETTDPPLSSIVQSAHQIGLRAGKLLHDLILGHKPPQQIIRLPPGGLIARRSSDYSAIKDDKIVAALNYIHLRCGHPITVVDVADHVGVSRRTLDKRCIACLGYPMAEQIRRSRIMKARQLLSTTSMQVTAIGFMCGYESPSGFVRAFREITGMTPGAHRRDIQR